MSAILELTEALEETETAQFVTTMLRDISATRLQSIRIIFEANRAYYSELHHLMEMVHTYAATMKVSLDTAHFGTGRIYVAVTSNKRFYGQLNQQVMTQFLARLREDPTSTGLVIGITGQQLLLRMSPQHSVMTIAFAADIPTATEISSVIAQLHGYNEVMVLHPTFINSFRQEPKATDVTHASLQEGDTTTKVEYICEPDVLGLLEFFRTQIRYVLFERVLLETRLALTGARLMKMQRARERAQELVREQRYDLHKVVSTISSMRLLETFTGFRSDRTI